MPDPYSESEYPDPFKAREEAQRILGQIHGVMWLATEEVAEFFPKESPTQNAQPALTSDNLRQAATEAHVQIGKLQAALNSGKCDVNLVQAGFAGAQGKAKRNGFWSAVHDYFQSAKDATSEYLGRLQNSLRWSSTLIGSIAVACKKEIERIPGGAAAGEAVKEFLDLLVNASEGSKSARRKSPGPDSGPSDKKKGDNFAGSTTDT